MTLGLTHQEVSGGDEALRTLRLERVEVIAKETFRANRMLQNHRDQGLVHPGAINARRPSAENLVISARDESNVSQTGNVICRESLSPQVGLGVAVMKLVSIVSL